MNDSKGTGTITDRKEWGQRDHGRRTGNREIYRHKDWDRGTGTKGQGQRNSDIGQEHEQGDTNRDRGTGIRTE